MGRMSYLPHAMGRICYLPHAMGRMCYLPHAMGRIRDLPHAMRRMVELPVFVAEQFWRVVIIFQGEGWFVRRWRYHIRNWICGVAQLRRPTRPGTMLNAIILGAYPIRPTGPGTVNWVLMHFPLEIMIWDTKVPIKTRSSPLDVHQFQCLVAFGPRRHAMWSSTLSGSQDYHEFHRKLRRWLAADPQDHWMSGVHKQVHVP
jgi:hypothetical protein